MEEIKIEITDIIKSIDETTTDFYQQKTDEGYKSLDITLELLILGINHILEYNSENNGIKIDEQQLNNLLTEAMKAIESKDVILLSDILQYDIKELFEDILKTL